ncbi:uncharacterized protein LOC110378352 [Helicoverpa armigera]|uniref:uncharacterized protein LOC110378352 n=1 Tax=Helicoverpa armigera TaxID=29058 RepID=UPI000B396953|nr:uncharacterized protein LOC110378352 [Helicoverpa armigera]
MELMTKEESYADRRQLFKDIWDTAMQIDDKDADIMSKPKVIKTLRLDEVDRCVIGKKKKERIKNLRTVCNKILDFCDRQDADDMFYEQIAEGKELSENKAEFKLKKTKHRRKKVKKAKIMFAPKSSRGDQPSTSEKKDDYNRKFAKALRKTSPRKVKRTTIVRRIKKRPSKVKSDSDTDTDENTEPGRASAPRRRVVRKKRSKRKKASLPNVPPPKPSGTSNYARYVPTPYTGRAIVRRIKQLLTENKIAVTSSTNCGN